VPRHFFLFLAEPRDGSPFRHTADLTFLFPWLDSGLFFFFKRPNFSLLLVNKRGAAFSPSGNHRSPFFLPPSPQGREDSFPPPPTGLDAPFPSERFNPRPFLPLEGRPSPQRLGFVFLSRRNSVFFYIGPPPSFFLLPLHEVALFPTGVSVPPPFLQDAHIPLWTRLGAFFFYMPWMFPFLVDSRLFFSRDRSPSLMGFDPFFPL